MFDFFLNLFGLKKPDAVFVINNIDNEKYLLETLCLPTESRMKSYRKGRNIIAVFYSNKTDGSLNDFRLLLNFLRGKEFCVYFESSLLEGLPKGQKAFLSSDKKKRLSCDDFVSFYRIVTQDGSNYEEVGFNVTFKPSSYLLNFQTIDLKYELYGAKRVRTKRYLHLICDLWNIFMHGDDEEKVIFEGIEPRKNRKLIVAENVNLDILRKYFEDDFKKYGSAYSYNVELLQTADGKAFVRFPDGICTIDFCDCWDDILSDEKIKTSDSNIYCYVEPCKLKNVTGNLCMLQRDEDGFDIVLGDDGKAWVRLDEDCEYDYYNAWKEVCGCVYSYKPYPAEELANAKVVATYKGEDEYPDQDELWDK